MRHSWGQGLRLAQRRGLLQRVLLVWPQLGPLHGLVWPEHHAPCLQQPHFQEQRKPDSNKVVQVVR